MDQLALMQARPRQFAFRLKMPKKRRYSATFLHANGPGETPVA